MVNNNIKLEVKNLDFFYGEVKALFNITMDIREKKVTALIGPSGCGKSTFIRVFNRMNDIILGTRLTGQVLFDGKNLYSNSIDVVDLRKKIGMVFQKSNPFPKSVL